MSFLEVLGAIVAGAGTFASILGVLLARVSRENGRGTRELIREMHERTDTTLRAIDTTLRTIEKSIERLGALVVSDGEKTRGLVKEILAK